MIRHLFKLIWHRKRTNLLLMIEIFFSFLVLFGVVPWASTWPRTGGGRSVSRPTIVWVVNVDMRVTTNDTFTASQVETMRLVLAGRSRGAGSRAGRRGALLPPYVHGRLESRVHTATAAQSSSASTR